MAKNSGKCELCEAVGSVLVWEPFCGILVFAPFPEQGRRFDQVIVCKKCQSRVYILMRGDSQAFSDCEYLEDYVRVMREAVQS